MHRILGERHPNGIANAIVQQRANADGRLDAAFLTIPRLGDAQMKGVVHTQFIHAGDK